MYKQNESVQTCRELTGWKVQKCYLEKHTLFSRRTFAQWRRVSNKLE